METNLTQGITEYWLRLPILYKEKLSQIRVWKSLRMATDGDDIWVRGIEPNQLHSPEIRSIPFKKIYFQQDHALFLLGGNVPEERLKTSLIWSPIHKALPLEIPAYNFNFFGIHETIEFRLVPSSTERETMALLVDLNVLHNYITEAPAIRLQSIQWTFIDKKALLIGTPVLPIPGRSYWQHHHYLIPTGYDFQYPELSNHYLKSVHVQANGYLVFKTDHTFYKLSTENIKPLSISGFRLSH